MIFLSEAVNTCMFSTSFKKCAAVLLKIKFLKNPRWWTCWETTIAMATVLDFKKKLDCYELANQWLLTWQSLIFYVQPFGKAWGGGGGGSR